MITWQNGRNLHFSSFTLSFCESLLRWLFFESGGDSNCHKIFILWNGATMRVVRSTRLQRRRGHEYQGKRCFYFIFSFFLNQKPGHNRTINRLRKRENKGGTSESDAIASRAFIARQCSSSSSKKILLDKQCNRELLLGENQILDFNFFLLFRTFSFSVFNVFDGRQICWTILDPLADSFQNNHLKRIVKKAYFECFWHLFHL